MANANDNANRTTKLIEAMFSAENTGGVDLDSIKCRSRSSSSSICISNVQIRREILSCNKCEKEFDSDAINCNPVNSFWSICAVELEELNKQWPAVNNAKKINSKSKKDKNGTSIGSKLSVSLLIF